MWLCNMLVLPHKLFFSCVNLYCSLGDEAVHHMWFRIKSVISLLEYLKLSLTSPTNVVPPVKITRKLTRCLEQNKSSLLLNTSFSNKEGKRIQNILNSLAVCFVMISNLLLVEDVSSFVRKAIIIITTLKHFYCGKFRYPSSVLSNFCATNLQINVFASVINDRLYVFCLIILNYGITMCL